MKINHLNPTTMKALKIENAPQSFANFLMAMIIPFRWSLRGFIVEKPDADKFRSFCIFAGMRESDVEKMEITEIEI